MESSVFRPYAFSSRRSSSWSTIEKNIYLCNKVYPLIPSQNTGIHIRHLINNTYVHTYFSKVVFFSHIKKYFIGSGHGVEGRFIPVGVFGVANGMEWGS